MIRFSASEPEILGLLRFLERRARRLLPMDTTGRTGSLLYVPLVTESRDDLRPRRTPRRMMQQVRYTDGTILWGIRLATDASHPFHVYRDDKKEWYHIDPEKSRLIFLALGPVLPEEEHAPEAAPERRREGIVELRDWVDETEEPTPDATVETPQPKGVVFLPQTVVARDLVERCTRRLRRRGNLIGNRWHVPPHLPDDEHDHH